MTREAKKPDAAKVQPLLAAARRAKPMLRQYKYVNSAANAAAKFTPSAYAWSGSTKKSNSRVGMNGKLCMLDQNGVPSSSREYQAGRYGCAPNRASPA